ncbi:MAG: GTP-binding protein [Phaeodactylibacter sp.]|nr:GTP-binding protein [Phaeodactylibacter sp.]
MSWLLLMDCYDLADFPLELYQTGNGERCLQNYRSWQHDLKKGRKRNRLFKLQICGNGTVGKTTILNRLKTSAFIEEDSTDGVQITFIDEARKWIEDYDPIRLMIWDFGGQEVYHQTHRLFLRDRSIFFLVFDEKTIKERHQKDPKLHSLDRNRELSYWISDIYRAGPKAQVILVQNKMDIPQTQEIYVDELLPKNIDQGRPVRISAKTGRHFEDLLMEMHRAVSELPSYKMEIPLSWWKVRETLLKKKVEKQHSKQQISLAVFKRLCQFCEVSPQSITALLTYLDGLGIILWDKELFPDTIILDQQWALNAVYTVL